MNKVLHRVILAIGVFTASISFGGTGPTLVEVTGGTAHQALMAVAFDQSSGVAVGAGGEILITQNDGKTWQPAAAPAPLGLLGVDIKGSLSIAVGQGGAVLVRDGGTDWKKRESGSTERLFSVAINSKGYAVTVGAFGTVLSSLDRGKNWKVIAPHWAQFSDAEQGDGFQPHIYGVNVDDAGVITIVGELGSILRTNNDGAKWVLLHKGDSVTRKETASLFALDMRTDGVAYAVGQEGMILKSSDGGSTWLQLNSGTQAILLGVCSSAKGGVVVTGMHDMIYSNNDGASWAHINDKSIASSWYIGVARPNAGPIVVVGNSGKIMRVEG